MNNIPSVQPSNNADNVQSQHSTRNGNNQAPFRAGDHTEVNRPNNGQGQNLRNEPADRIHLRNLNTGDNTAAVPEAQAIEVAEQVFDLEQEALDNLPIANEVPGDEIDAKKALFADVENLKNELVKIVSDTQYKGLERANLLRTTKSDYKNMLSHFAKHTHQHDDLVGQDNQALNTYKHNVAHYTIEHMMTRSDLGYRIGRELLNHMGISLVTTVQAESINDML